MQEIQEAADCINPEELLAFADAMRSGKFSARLPAMEGDTPTADAVRQFNWFAWQMEIIISELARLSNELKQGEFGGQAEIVVSLRLGPMRQCLKAFNAMEWALTDQIRNFAKTASRLAESKNDRLVPVSVECQGEMAKFKNSLNTLVDRTNGHKH